MSLTITALWAKSLVPATGKLLFFTGVITMMYLVEFFYDPLTYKKYSLEALFFHISLTNALLKINFIHSAV